MPLVYNHIAGDYTDVTLVCNYISGSFTDVSFVFNHISGDLDDLPLVYNHIASDIYNIRGGGLILPFFSTIGIHFVPRCFRYSLIY